MPPLPVTLGTGCRDTVEKVGRGIFFVVEMPEHARVAT
jgi:hypothetical protein